MPLLAPFAPPKPLFVAKLVRLELDARVGIADARRDLTAVGFTGFLATAENHHHSLLVFRGRSALREGNGDGEWPSYEPVALLPGDRFVLAIERRSNLYEYRTARTTATGFRLGARVPKPVSRRDRKPDSKTFTVYPVRLWPAARNRREFEPTIDLSWWRLSNDVHVGSGMAQASPDADGTDPRYSLGVSLVALGGKSWAPLATVVALPKGTHLRELLWVSPEGWMIARAGSAEADHALAWLLPTKA